MLKLREVLVEPSFEILLNEGLDVLVPLLTGESLVLLDGLDALFRRLELQGVDQPSLRIIGRLLTHLLIQPPGVLVLSGILRLRFLRFVLSHRRPPTT